jgi:hypothetical protein
MAALQIEARAYGPDSTPEEIAAIKARVYLYAPDIIMWQEVPVMSVFQVEMFGEKSPRAAQRPRVVSLSRRSARGAAARTRDPRQAGGRLQE